MNETIFYFFYNLAHKSDFFDSAVTFLAVYFPLLILFGICVLIFYRRNWRESFLVFFSGGLAIIIDQLLKFLIQSPRPFLAFTNVLPLFPETGYAFPSGHAAFFSSLAFALFFINRKTGFIFMFFALLIGLARIIAGVHFPIDILGGFLLGFGVAYFVKSV